MTLNAVFHDTAHRRATRSELPPSSTSILNPVLHCSLQRRYCKYSSTVKYWTLESTETVMGDDRWLLAKGFMFRITHEKEEREPSHLQSSRSFGSALIEPITWGLPFTRDCEASDIRTWAVMIAGQSAKRCEKTRFYHRALALGGREKSIHGGTPSGSHVLTLTKNYRGQERSLL